jgi:tetratricopeptide (TPR) repeat protein
VHSTDHDLSADPRLARLEELDNLFAEVDASQGFEASRPVAEELIELCRELAKDDPDRYLPKLAQSLSRLGQCRMDLEQYEAAIEPLQEADAIFRALGQEKMEQLTARYAANLSELATYYGRVDQHERAAEFSREAIEQFRLVASQNPNSYAGVLMLADELGNLGFIYMGAKNVTGAIASIRESVDLYRTLTPSNPDEHLLGLAMRLETLGLCLYESGENYEAAIPSLQEAVEIFRTVANDQPDRCWQELAASLDNLGRCHEAMGQDDVAIRLYEESDAISCQFERDNDPKKLHARAMRHLHVAFCYQRLGRFEPALALGQEVVESVRALLENGEETYTDDLATSLGFVGLCLTDLGQYEADLGQYEAAIARLKEAESIYRLQAEDNSPQALSTQALILQKLANCYKHLGQYELAVAVLQKAVELGRIVAVDNPDELPMLAAHLFLLSCAQDRLENVESASTAARESADIYRTLAKGNPVFLPDLALCLYSLGLKQICWHSSYEAAASVLEEAVELYRMLAKDSDDGHRCNLASVLSDLANAHYEVGRYGSAASLVDESIALFRSLMTDEADADLIDRLDQASQLSSKIRSHLVLH